MNKPRNGIVWKGRSPYDGTPIAAILTGVAAPGASVSENRKTGALAQLWILVDGESATQVIADGRDKAICGDCKMRADPESGRPNRCYVMSRTPETISKKLRGMAVRVGAIPTEYPEAVPAPGQAVRLGSYGDPGFLPLPVLRRLVRIAGTWTGYTHQWQRLKASTYGRYLMASCDSPEEARQAKALGWRVFLVRPVGATGPGWARAGGGRWLQCPASEEAGKRTTCERCTLCGGGDGKGSLDIWINAHGTSRMAV